MNRIITASLVAAVCMFGAGCASIPQSVWVKPIEYSSYLQDEGPVVSYPTAAGFVVGLPTTIVTMPLWPFLEGIDEGGEEGIAASMGAFMLGPSLVGDVVGTPFLALKKTFWDFPKWLFIRKEEEDETSNNEMQATN